MYNPIGVVVWCLPTPARRHFEWSEAIQRLLLYRFRLYPRNDDKVVAPTSNPPIFQSLTLPIFKLLPNNILIIIRQRVKVLHHQLGERCLLLGYAQQHFRRLVIFHLSAKVKYGLTSGLPKEVT